MQRVLILTDEYDYSHYTFIYNEILNLKNSGIEVYVICERIGKLRKSDANYSCIPLTNNKLLRTLYLWANNKKLFRIVSFYHYFTERKKLIKKYNPDLIHVHFGDTAVRFYFALEATFKNYPFLISFHGFDASSHLNNTYYLERLKLLIEKPNVYIVYVSKNLKKNLLAKGIKVNERNSFLLYYGIDISIFHRTNRQHNTLKKFVQVSNFIEKKGHIYTLSAFKKFIEKSPGKGILVLGGDGPLRNELIQQSVEFGLTDVVTFPGWITREQAVSFFDEADYFVHHSITSRNGDQEGLPNSIIEAMAMELPVLSTFHSGIPEIVEEGVNGYLVNEKDVDAYAQVMEDILSWDYLPDSREKVIREFSLDVHTFELKKIYSKIINY